jgi:hypothetical protein
MPRRKGRRDPTKPDELRAYDGRGNVRPADDRFLTGEQRAAKEQYVEEVTPDVDKEAREIAAALDTSAFSRPEATPVTSPRVPKETPDA